MSRAPKPQTGIEVRHAAGCASSDGRRCSCSPSFRAEAYDKRAGKKVRKTFPSRQAAINWRQDALVGLRKGKLRAPTALTIDEAARGFIEDCREGRALSRKRKAYAPSTVRGYERVMRLHVLPHFGNQRVSDIDRVDIQQWVDSLVASGLQGSTVTNAADPLRRIFDRALKRDLIGVDPTDGVEWPASAKGRDRVASPVEAERLISCAPEGDRPLWATAMYTGLRRGELRALRFSDIDREKSEISVSRRWDDVEGELDGGKTDAARRRVPLIPELRTILAEHKLATGRGGNDLVFGSTSKDAFQPSNVRRRALAAWRAAGLSPIGLHECRHTYASLMIHAGVNIKAISTYMGHASVAITLDRYGHLLPNSEAESAERFQSYLNQARETSA